MSYLIKKIFFGLSMLWLLSSCNQNDVEGYLSNAYPEIEPEEYIDIKYDGKVYENVPISYDENGDFIFLDDEFSVVYILKLKNSSTLSIHYEGDNEISIYDNLQSNLKDHKITIPPMMNENLYLTRTDISNDHSLFLGIVTLYDDKNFKDRSVQIGLIKEATSYENPDLNASHKFNDKCSSMILENNLTNDPNQKVKLPNGNEYPHTAVDLVFIGYDDKNFADRTYTIIATPTNKIRKIASVSGFGDKMSSCKLFFATHGSYTFEGPSK